MLLAHIVSSGWKEEILSPPPFFNTDTFFHIKRFSSLVFVIISAKYASVCNHVVHVEQFDR
jgi:hypothetical protein